MVDSYFTLIEATPTGGRYVATKHTVGPWSPNLQHGGPPNALAVTAAERLVTQQTGRDDLEAVRLSADFLGPVPLGEIEVRARLLRTARSAALVEVVVAADGRDCLHARVWFVRTAESAHVSGPDRTPPPVPDGPGRLGVKFGYGASLDWRFLHGDMAAPGPAAVWVRATHPLVDDEPLSGLARVVLIADSGNGVSSELDWSTWSFVNVDLDVHLARPIEGEWVLLDAVTQLGTHGSGLARSTLSDVRGVVGTALQTLVLVPVG